MLSDLTNTVDRHTAIADGPDALRPPASGRSMRTLSKCWPVTSSLRNRGDAASTGFLILRSFSWALPLPAPPPAEPMLCEFSVPHDHSMSGLAGVLPAK